MNSRPDFDAAMLKRARELCCGNFLAPDGEEHEMHYAIARALSQVREEALEEAWSICARQADFWHRRSGLPKNKMEPDAAAAHILAGRIRALKRGGED